jgi:hypothetical protein
MALAAAACNCLLQPIEDQIAHVARRLANWRSLRTTDNADKKIAVIFYNHPPGRHNIGADNLDVVESLFEFLHATAVLVTERLPRRLPCYFGKLISAARLKVVP